MFVHAWWIPGAYISSYTYDMFCANNSLTARGHAASRISRPNAVRTDYTHIQLYERRKRAQRQQQRDIRPAKCGPQQHKVANLPPVTRHPAEHSVTIFCERASALKAQINLFTCSIV